MNNIFYKLIGAHFFITIIILIVMSLATNDETYILVIVLSFILYFYSGYKLTKTKVNWINYFGVAAIGIVCWLTCYIISPESTNYNRDDAGLWFFYNLYIMVNSPLNFIDSWIENYNLKKELIMLFIVPPLISILQFSGSKYRLWEIVYDEKEKLNRKN